MTISTEARAGTARRDRGEVGTLRIVVVDDHELVRDGLKALLSREPGMEVVAEADGVAQALRRVVAEEPDIVTMDLNLPDGSGVDACRAIKTISPETQVLILTAFADADLLDCRAAGAAGYVLKRTGDLGLVAKIRQIAAGGTAFDGAPPKRRERTLDRLTPRELSILELIAEGRTNREIAEQLFLAEKTVKKTTSPTCSPSSMSVTSPVGGGGLPRPRPGIGGPHLPRRRTGRGAEPTDVGHGPRPVKHLAHASVRYQPPQSRGIWSRSSPTSTASWSELRYGFTS